MPIALILQLYSLLQTILFILREIRTIGEMIQTHKVTPPGAVVVKPIVPIPPGPLPVLPSSPTGSTDRRGGG